MAFGIPRPPGGPVPVNLPSAAPQQLAMPAPPPPAPPSPLEHMSSQMMAPIAQALQPKPKINWLGVLADALAGAAGRQGPYASMLMQQRQLAQEEQVYQNHKGDDLQNQIALYAYKAAHPETPDPSTYERELQAAGYTPGTPEFAKRIGQHLDTVDDPIVTVSLPGNRVYSGPRSGLAAALSGGATPTAPVGKLTPLGAGGQTATPSGGFPR